MSPHSSFQPSAEGSLVARLIGLVLIFFGLLTIGLAARQLLSHPAEEGNLFVSIHRSTLWLHIVFGGALLPLGTGIMLRQAWTRGLDWISCIIIALLIPSGFDALYGLIEGSRWGTSFPLLVMPAAEVALLILAAVLLYRNSLPDRAAAGIRYERPRVTFVSRALGVLLILSGVTRLWLTAVLGPELLDKLVSLLPERPAIPLTIASSIVWSAGLAIATIVLAFGLGLRRRWGMQLGLPLSVAGFIVDVRAALVFPSQLGPGYLDFVILRYASATLYAVVAAYCAVQLLRGRKVSPVASQQRLHYPPETRPEIADDTNWRQSLVASLRAGGAQPATKNVLTGVILPVLGIVVIGLGTILMNALIRLEPPAGSSGPNFALIILLTLGLTAIAILLVQRLLAFCWRRLWRFRARNAEEELERSGSRRPVLYLRPFALDEEIARPTATELLLGSTPTATAEQQLARTLSRRRGPVIAIGLPGERLPGLGAARFYAGHDVWHQKVADAAHVAQLVVWTTGTTEGLCWEISHLLKSVPPGKLIVWAHPHILHLDRAEREEEWSEFLAKLGSVFLKPLPTKLGKTRFIWFKDDWEPVSVAPRWGVVGLLFRFLRNAQIVALKQTLRQKTATQV
jgi:hypothetical protein